RQSLRSPYTTLFRSVREEHLRRVQAVAAKAALVALHESHLAHGGGSLQLVHGLRPARPAEALHALGNGAAGDEDDSAAFAHEARDRKSTRLNSSHEW